jgi:hypothetical protein
MREDYSDGYIAPECQDPEGTKSIVPVEFDIERLRAEGKLSPAELKQQIIRKFKDGVYHSRARPGIAYMLCPVVRLYGGPAQGSAPALQARESILSIPFPPSVSIASIPTNWGICFSFRANP